MIRLQMLALNLMLWNVALTMALSGGIHHRAAASLVQRNSLGNSPLHLRQPILVFLAQSEEESYSDLPPEESTEYTGSVDWDAEWKKVVASQGKLEGDKERPGKGFYKSEAEIQAIKVAKAASENISKAGSTVSNVLPDFRSLSGNWRFWIAILVLISVGLSVLTAPSNIVPSGLQGDSYYI